MKKILISGIMAALLLLSAGCEKIIEFEGEELKPRLTLSSYAEAGTPLTVYVASSIFFLSNQKSGAAFTEGLDTLRGSVRCYVNGEKQSRTMLRCPDGDYAALCYQNPDYVPEPGDHIRLEAEFPGFDPVWAETDVPRLPDFEVLSAKWNKVNLDGITDWYDDDSEYYELEITLAVKDDGSYDKYYFLQPVAFLQEEWLPEGYWTYYRFSSNDIIFRELSGGNAMSTLTDDSEQYYFSDALIKGQRHVFTITTDMIYDRERIQYFGIITATVNEGVYWYDQSFQQVESGLGGIFAEGTTLYSNVHGGYGFFGSSAPVLLDVEW